MKFKDALIQIIKEEPTLITGLVVAVNAVWAFIFPETVAALIVGIEGALIAIGLRAFVMTAAKATAAIKEAAQAGAEAAVANVDEKTVGALGETATATTAIAEASKDAANEVLATAGLKTVAVHAA